MGKDTFLRHICENCGKEETLTSEQGFQQGWDYPPRMGMFGVLSPRTCGNCTIDTTLWWRVTCEEIQDLSEKDLKILNRILDEPESILV